MKRELKGKFKKLGIFIVYLFGSKAIGRGSKLSDIDIGVVFKNPPLREDTRSLYNILYTLFSELYPDSKLDIVLLQTASLPLQYFAIKDGKILYEEDPIFTADFENLVINQYLDFKPVLDFFDRVATERYAKI
jgi:predicted nucleotidyltransferase